MSTDPNKPAAPSWDDVRRLADELRLKVHLAGMEFKERWKELEPQVHALERKLEHKGAEVEAMIAAQGDAVAAALGKMLEEVRESLRNAK
jgi:hypothetical protein